MPRRRGSTRHEIFESENTENTKEEKEDKKLVSFLRGEMNLMREAGEKSRAIYVFLCKE